MRVLICLTIISLMAAQAAAATLDGSISGDGYGAARAVQTVNTDFGDNASELNAGYAQISGGALWLTLTGNIEANFNKLNIFIDTGAGGENVLTADANNGGNNPENDNWANMYDGFTFDSEFDANYMVIVRRGGTQFDFDFATVGGGLGAFEASGDIFAGAVEGTNATVGASAIGVSYDNSNVAGVVGGSGAADTVAAAAVTTGLELVIPLSAIGNPDPNDILVSAHVNGSNHDFLSNQSLAGFPAPQINLGGDGAGNWNGSVGGIDLTQFGGNQHFAVVPVPEPSSLALLMGLAWLGVVGVSRRRS